MTVSFQDFDAGTYDDANSSQSRPNLVSAPPDNGRNLVVLVAGERSGSGQANGAVSWFPSGNTFTARHFSRDVELGNASKRHSAFSEWTDQNDSAEVVLQETGWAALTIFRRISAAWWQSSVDGTWSHVESLGADTGTADDPVTLSTGNGTPLSSLSGDEAYVLVGFAQWRRQGTDTIGPTGEDLAGLTPSIAGFISDASNDISQEIFYAITQSAITPSASIDWSGVLSDGNEAILGCSVFKFSTGAAGGTGLTPGSLSLLGVGI